MPQTCSIGERSGDLSGQGRVLMARRHSRDMRATWRRWSSASRVKRDFHRRTICDGNHDDWLRCHSEDSASQVRCLKGRCERNPTSAKGREMVEGTMGVKRM
ncbi:hypothetical protein TNCV_402641 [Trichonephila clavipes]|nr:hypothetical protein TNCV_402641 [Trichonephila clavipes]